MPIRRWLAVVLGVVFFVPVFLVFLTAVVVSNDLGQPGAAAEQAVERLRSNAARWTDPAWQDATRVDLAADGLAFVLMSNGREVYRSSVDPLLPADGGDRRVVERVTVAANPSLVAYLFVNDGRWPPGGNHGWQVPVVALLSSMTTVAASAWFLGRTVVNPLAAASRAAGQVAAGDLDVALPSSRVREVAELNAAFEAMSAELRASLRRQAKLEQERRLFIGAVAHDLRTPLFSLRGHLAGLADGIADTPEKAARYVAVAQEKADALERLIADLFTYSRLEHLDQAPRCEPLDFGALLGRLVDGLRPQAEDKGVDLCFVEPPAPCVVDGDAHLLTRAIENLLDNAVRYTPSDGTVRVSCRPESNRIAFAVADTGPGIVEQDLPHIFAPLYRGERSRNRRTGGAGLGLTTAHRVLIAHNGALFASNGPGGGACFTGMLPSIAPSPVSNAAGHRGAPLAGSCGRPRNGLPEPSRRARRARG